MVERHNVRLNVNGEIHEISVEARRSLADALREDCFLTGTHVGCEHGVCGACTVLIDSRPVRSCLTFAVQHHDGGAIETVESLSDGNRLHPLQQAFWEQHGLQCGFCTPGFLMLVVGALRENPDMSLDEICEVLSSNLCRCTGYQNIVSAVCAAAKVLRAEGRAA